MVMNLRSILFAWLAIVLVATPPAAAHADRPQEVTAQIKSAASGKFKKFYKARGFLPIWARNGTIGPEADRLIGMLRTADLDGLDPRDYDPDGLRRAVVDVRNGNSAALGRTELKLSKAFYAYVRDLRDPGAFRSDKIVFADPRMKPQRLLPADVLMPAAIAPSLDVYLAASSWMNPIYDNLRDALEDFRKHWDDLPAGTVATGAPLRLGASGERVRDLRHRLGLADGSRFDKPLAWKVRVFQMEHGLPATGIADSATIAALNRNSSSYEQRIRLNLQRVRLLPPASTRQVVVNIADAKLMMFGEGKQQGEMRVVVGKPNEQTPVMAGMISYAILNPYWNVPTDLVRDRVAPKVLAGQTFEGMHYEALSDWTAHARLLRPNEIDWKAVADGRQELRVRMLPGAANWMGKMKFMFPNELGIYLHDFPDKSIFSEDRRQLSSGCVRLSDAARLGQWLYGRPLETRSPAPEQYVTLPKPVPIYITYLTVTAGDKGIAYLDDPYGRDGAGQEQQLARR